MSNEEKSKELAINVMANRHFESNGLCQRKQIENALMEMAQWKEQEMVKKACEWLNNNTVTSDNGSVIYTASSHNIDKKTFIEQLKKAMEE